MTVAVTNSPAAWSARAAAASTHEAVGWTPEGQAERFAAVLKSLTLRTDDRLLDFGCGTGAFSDVLPETVAYVGFDWSEGMIGRARADHPGRRFTRDFPGGKFDHVVCIGPFNLPDGWSKQHTWHTIRHLWDTTGCRTLVASLYSGLDKRCLVYTKHELERCGLDLGVDVKVRLHRHNDLLLVARR